MTVVLSHIFRHWKNYRVYPVMSPTPSAEAPASADGRACSPRRDLTHPTPGDIALPPLAVRQHTREKRKARWRLGVPW